jgi:hypothetical protein
MWYSASYDSYVGIFELKQKMRKRFRRLDKLKRSIGKYCGQAFFKLKDYNPRGGRKERSPHIMDDANRRTAELHPKADEPRTAEAQHCQRRRSEQLASMGTDPQVCRSYVQQRVGRMPSVVGQR